MRPRELPGGYAPVPIAFLLDPRPNANDRAVFAAVVSSLDFEKLSGNVRVARIAERAGLHRSTAGRSLRRISVWGYWTMGRRPGGSWRFELTVPEVEAGVASEERRPRRADSLEGATTATTSTLSHDGESDDPTDPVSRVDADLASDERRRSPRRATTSTQSATTPQSFSPEKRLTAGAPSNGAGGYDPDAEYVPSPDDPKLFEPDGEEPAPSGAWWTKIPNPWSADG